MGGTQHRTNIEGLANHNKILAEFSQFSPILLLAPIIGTIFAILAGRKLKMLHRGRKPSNSCGHSRRATESAENARIVQSANDEPSRVLSDETPTEGNQIVRYREEPLQRG